MRVKERIFTWISRHRNILPVRALNRFNSFINDAVANKNNNHSQNGELEIQKRLIPLNLKIIFDVGANKGEWASRISHFIPESTIFAFEPIPITFQKLKHNLSDFQQVKLYNFGLSDQEETAKFYQFSANSLFSSKFDRIEFREKTQVSVSLTTGDKFCLDSGIDFIDFLKIDVEGLEMAVLNGFEKMLSEKRIKLIQFEYGYMNIESRIFLKDFYNFLLPKGYLLGKLYPNGVEFRSYNYHMDDFKWSNYIAVLKSEIELIKVVEI